MSNSGSSDSDEFYDAESDSPTNLSRRSTKRRTSSRGTPRPAAAKSVVLSGDGELQVTVASPEVRDKAPSPDIESQIQILTGDELSGRDQRWSRLERLRRREDKDLEDFESPLNVTATPPDSTESSVEGIFVSGVRSLHPFKVVESDSRSVQSETRSASRSASGVALDSVEQRPQLKARNSQDLFLTPPPVLTKVKKGSSLDSPPCDTPPDQCRCQDSLSALATSTPFHPNNQNMSPCHPNNQNIPPVGPFVVPDIVSSATSNVEVGPRPPVEPPNFHNPPAPPNFHEKKTAPPIFHEQPPSPPNFHEQPPAVPRITPASPPAPVAPPRRKKLQSKSSTASSCSLVGTEATNSRPSSLPFTPSVTPPAFPSPTSTVASLTKDLESSLTLSPMAMATETPVLDLNLTNACRGEFVVKPQDNESTRGTMYSSERALYPDLTRKSLGSGTTGTLENQDSCFSPDPTAHISSPSLVDSRAGIRSLDRSPDRNLGSRKSSIKSMGITKGDSGGSRTDGHHSSGSGGHRSGGSGGHHGFKTSGGRGSGGSDRRSTAGSAGSDSGMVKQMGLFLRTKSDSGKRMSDLEILQQVKVKNLDTGTEMDLATAEDQLPEYINPLSLHMMRLTSEYTVSSPGDRSADSDTDSLVSSASWSSSIGQGKKKFNVSRIFGGVAKGAKSAVKNLNIDVSRRPKSKEEKEEEKLGRLTTDIVTTDGAQVSSMDGNRTVSSGFKRIQSHKTGPSDFEGVQFGQDLSGHHNGPIWCMKFSLCGRLLATAGQDCILRIWVLRDKYEFFADMRARYQVEHEGLSSEENAAHEAATSTYLSSPESQGHIFMGKPFVTYTGHTSDLLDVSWSKNFFILTSSMDKTVRLWHISRKECLCCFQHIDFVTAIAFHPKNDQFFISGSLDGKIRLWNIPDKKVALWNEVDGTTKLITAANFCGNGKFAAVGTYDGRCIFYSTDQLKYFTTIHVRSSRGKNSRGRKVTGLEPMPGEDKILITSNDSRIRLYDLRSTDLVCKYKGYTNLSSQIRASFSPDGRYICAGSENHCLYLWATSQVGDALTARKDRNTSFEAVKAHAAVVTCSVFSPAPELVMEAVQRGREAAGKGRDNNIDVNEERTQGYVIISGDFEGDIKIFINQTKVKPSSVLPIHLE